MSNLNIKIIEATIKQRPIIERLMQLYLHDFSEIDNCDVNQDGIYEYEYLDHYWKEKDRIPFLIYVNANIAGFVLVNSYTYIQRKGRARSIAEFFIMRKYRKQKIGKAAAFDIFDKFPGSWEVRETAANIPAQRFWRKIIDEYTEGNYNEEILDTDDWQGPVQIFETGRDVE